jgi:hypothetical protein
MLQEYTIIFFSSLCLLLVYYKKMQRPTYTIAKVSTNALRVHHC